MQDCMTKIFRNLTDKLMCNLNINIYNSIPRTCFVTLVSHPCDILEGKDIGYVRHRLSVMHPCVRFKVTMNIQSRDDMIYE